MKVKELIRKLQDQCYPNDDVVILDADTGYCLEILEMDFYDGHVALRCDYQHPYDQKENDLCIQSVK